MEWPRLNEDAGRLAEGVSADCREKSKFFNVFYRLL
jgi:hypothetical protein